MRAGRTSAMYWSAATMLSTSAVPAVVANSALRSGRAGGRIDELGEQAELFEQRPEVHRGDDEPDRLQHAVHAAPREQGVHILESRVPGSFRRSPSLQIWP